MKREVNFFAPEAMRENIFDMEVFTSGLMGAPARRFDKREAIVTAVEQLYAEKMLKLTEESIGANMGAITLRALKVAKDAESRHSEAPSVTFSKMPHPSTILRWTRNASKHGRGGLLDNFERRGNQCKSIGSDEIAILSRVIREKYLTMERPFMTTSYADARLAFKESNKLRKEEGKAPLRIPSYSSFTRLIDKLDPYMVTLLRHGADVARKKYKPVTGSVGAERPMQRVEIDAVKLDVMTFMTAHGMFGLTPEECASLGFDKKKARWTLTVAICCATRCIVGMKLSRSDKSEAALEVLEMMLTDKGEWIDSIGSTGMWNMFGLPEEIVTDCGAAFIAATFRRACADLGIVTTRSVAGIPELRGTIERFFGSLNTGLIPNLTGRTFSNVGSKGDNDPELRTALTTDDICFALTRWIVDVYHNTPQRGLNGETPARCWRRLSKEWGISCPPSTGDMRLVFGEQLDRVVSREGIKVCGVRYHSKHLAEWMLRNSNHEVQVRWHPKDIGTLLVHLSGKWVEVPSVLDGLDGVHAQTWLTAMRQLKASHPRLTEFEANVIDDALKAISQCVGDAKLTAKLVVETWSPARIAAEENRLFMNFKVKGNERAAYVASMDGELITGTPLPEGVDDDVEAVVAQRTSARADRKAKRAAKTYQIED